MKNLKTVLFLFDSWRRNLIHLILKENERESLMRKKFKDWIKRIPQNGMLSVVAGGVIFVGMYIVDITTFQYSLVSAFVESSILAIAGSGLVYSLFKLVDRKEEAEKNQRVDTTNYLEKLNWKRSHMYNYQWGEHIILSLKQYVDAVKYAEKHCSLQKEELIYWKTAVSKQIWEVLAIFEKLDNENKEQMRDKIVNMLIKKELELHETYVKPYQTNLVTSCEKKLEEITEQKQERIYLSE